MFADVSQLKIKRKSASRETSPEARKYEITDRDTGC
jgi:hypothetical protein